MMQVLEWTQEEFLKNRKALQNSGVDVLLIDTIANPIDGIQTLLYNPFELQKYPQDTIFVFYCDTGKSTKERLHEYQNRFPDKKCISLRGGRGYWRKTLRV